MWVRRGVFLIVPLLIAAGLVLEAPAASAVIEHGPTVWNASPAVDRGATFFGEPERFNRYYTDPSWTPLRTVFVSPSGGGSGATRGDPTTPHAAIADVRPGDLIQFEAGTYVGSGGSDASLNLGARDDGTYQEPIILRADRGPNGEYDVVFKDCGSRACINMEFADYVAVDGFRFVSGAKGIRFAGDSSAPNIGGVALDNRTDGMGDDGIFTGRSDWLVVEGNHTSDSVDEHGIYVSNGGDFGILRGNESDGNNGTGVQINADPHFVCGHRLDAKACWGSAKNGLGNGISEFWLVEDNYFHNDQVGMNLTSVRNSIVRNNAVVWNDNHGVAIWQEVKANGGTGSVSPDQMDPRYGGKHMRIADNVFAQTIGTNYALSIVSWATKAQVVNNVFVGSGENHPLVNLDSSTADASFSGNLFAAAGSIDGTRGTGDTVKANFDPGWFQQWDASGASPFADLAPADVAGSPVVSAAPFTSLAPEDAFGKARPLTTVDRGPIEVPA
ncbi:MAG: hypothetical protein ACJ76P_03735 [Actinomycetota bacterium]